MRKLDRRHFLFASTAAAVSLPLLAQGSAEHSAVITLHPEQKGPAVPEDFVGLSYEIEQLSDPNFFSPENKGLIAQFRKLSPKGVLRLGGNTSDVGWWKPTADAPEPPLPKNVVLQTPPGEKSPMDLAYAVTPEAVRNLRGFLDATGWTCLYGINLGTNTPERAADEAEFVHKTLGPRLQYFQVGNEPDGFGRRFRDKATWNADAYLHDWLAEANAIRARVPEAKFGLPDVASNVKWFEPIAEKLGAMADRPHIVAVTHHYYFGGPPSNPKVNLGALLHADPRVERDANLAKDAAAKLDCRYRMTEGNTCYRGGKPGVSDVFGASLWAADYMLTLATLGYAGVNLHGGSGKEVANSLGGTLPGEKLMPDPTVPHPRPFYTPIATMDNEYVAEPVFFGMRFAQQFAGTQLMRLEFDPGAVNATAYAAKTPEGKRLVAILNKDDAAGLHVKIAGARGGCVAKLTAPSLTSRDVTWTGGAADEPHEGLFRCMEMKVKNGVFSVPAASALLIELA